MDSQGNISARLGSTTAPCIFCHKRANLKEHLWPKWRFRGAGSVITNRDDGRKRPDVTIEDVLINLLKNVHSSGGKQCKDGQ